MNRFLLAMSLAVGITCTTYALVYADGSAGVDAGITVPVGSGLAPPSVVVAPVTITALPPATTLPDPLEHPLAALDDVKMTVKTTWPIAVFAILVMLTKALAYAAASLQSTPIVGGVARWLAQAKHAMAVAVTGALAAAAYNTLVTGGTVAAAVVAAGIAYAGLLHSTTQPKSSS